MLKLSRALAVAAVFSSTVLCAPIPQDAGKPISTGQSADPSAPASSVFGTTPQKPNYQTRPTKFCVVPALTKDAGLSQGQEQLTVQQGIQLCPEAMTIAPPAPNGSAPVPLPVPEPQRDTPHPARAVDRDGQPPEVGALPPPASEPLPGGHQPPVTRDLPPQPALAPQPDPLSPHPGVTRSQPIPPPLSPEAPQPEPTSLHPVTARSVPEQPPTIAAPAPEPVPDSPAPRPSQVVAQSQSQHQSIPQPEPILESVPKPVSQPNAPDLNTCAEHPQVPRPNTEAPPQPGPHSGAPLSA